MKNMLPPLLVAVLGERHRACSRTWAVCRLSPLSVGPPAPIMAGASGSTLVMALRARTFHSSRLARTRVYSSPLTP